MSPGIGLEKSSDGSPQGPPCHSDQYRQRQMDNEGQVRSEPLRQGVPNQGGDRCSDGKLSFCADIEQSAFEGKRQRIATEGLEQLSQHVDSLIVIPNDKLTQVLGNTVTLDEAFKAANDVLHGAVAGIAEIIKKYAIATCVREPGKAYERPVQ